MTEPRIIRTVRLEQQLPATNAYKFWECTLFANGDLHRHWGRIGTKGQEMLESYDIKSGLIKLQMLVHVKMKDGYVIKNDIVFREQDGTFVQRLEIATDLNKEIEQWSKTKVCSFDAKKTVCFLANQNPAVAQFIASELFGDFATDLLNFASRLRDKKISSSVS